MKEGLTEGVTDYHVIIQAGQYIYHRETLAEQLSGLVPHLKSNI